jgi:hypothetical protein
MTLLRAFALGCAFFRQCMTVHSGVHDCTQWNLSCVLCWVACAGLLGGNCSWKACCCSACAHIKHPAMQSGLVLCT